MAANSPILLTAGTEDRDLTRLDEYREVGGYEALEKARGDGAAGRHGRDLGRHAARARRGRVPDGPQGVAPGEGHRQARLPRGERRRVGARRVQGSRRHAPHASPPDRGLPDHRPRDRLGERLHLHPRRVPARVRGHAGRPRRRTQGEAARRRDDRPPPRRRRLHLRRGDRAPRVARGAAWTAAAATSVPAGERALRRADPDQQRLDDRARPEGARARRQRSSPRSACRRRREPRSSRSPATSPSPGTTSARSGRRSAS